MSATASGGSLGLGQLSDQGVGYGLGFVALDSHSDLVALSDAQAHDHQNAAGVYGIALALGYGDLATAGCGGLREFRSRPGMNADRVGDDSGTLRCCHGDHLS